ncbi:hypothetical protein [Bacillus shivajii]|nr:hypothetical protein [Bacillus shivajii]
MDPTKDNNKKKRDNQAMNEQKNKKEKQNRQHQTHHSYSKKPDHL